MFKMEFGTDNDAFVGYKEAEVSRILKEIAARVVLGYVSGSIHDINGGRIGDYELTQAPKVEIGQTSSDSCRLEDIVEGIKDLIPEGLFEEFGMYDESEDDEAARAGIFEEICDYLNEIAPEGAHFGTQEGDGACYGFWKDEDEEAAFSAAEKALEEMKAGYNKQVSA